MSIRSSTNILLSRNYDNLPSYIKFVPCQNIEPQLNECKQYSGTINGWRGKKTFFSRTIPRTVKEGFLTAFVQECIIF